MRDSVLPVIPQLGIGTLCVLGTECGARPGPKNHPLSAESRAALWDQSVQRIFGQKPAQVVSVLSYNQVIKVSFPCSFLQRFISNIPA